MNLVEEYKKQIDKFLDVLHAHSADVNILNEKEESVVDVCIQKLNYNIGRKILEMGSFQVEKTSKQQNNLLHRLGKAVLEKEGMQMV